jgi:hypothetical protein
MDFDELLCGPTWPRLKSVVCGGAPLLITAYYGVEMLTRISHVAPAGTKLLVRMPKPSAIIPVVLPNDPASLLDFMQTQPAARVFASPSLHAKIFVSKNEGLIGSSNLSGNGFSGANEACLHTVDPVAIAALRKAARAFIIKSEELQPANVQALIDAVSVGVAKVSSPPDAVAAEAAIGSGQAANPPFNSFEAWLAGQKEQIALDVLAFAKGKNNMNGHTYTGYQGLCIMMRADPIWARSLAKKNWMDDSILVAMGRIGPFVKAHPGEVTGKISAVWESSYLPKSLGGKVANGGAGQGVLRRMMVLIPRFLVSKKII